MTASSIYQFRAQLDDMEPEIWRRFQVSDDITPAQLCYILQTLFEMKASHLMSLKPPSKSKNEAIRYEIIDENSDILDFSFPGMRKITTLDATEGTLRDIGLSKGKRWEFWYDFGDDWFVTLKLEKIIEAEEAVEHKLPYVLEGVGFGIIEDCGGIPGLMELVEIFKKKKGKAYQQASEWLDTKDFDINAFDLDEMNLRLQKVPAIFQRIYEKRKMPTQKEIDLIERLKK